MKNQIRTHITKSRAGHYTVTIRAIQPWGTMGHVVKESFIDSLPLARQAAAKYIEEYKAGKRW